MLLSSLDKVIKEPIELQGDSLKVFKTERFGNVLVVLIKKDPKLQRLHESLLRAISPYIQTSKEHEGQGFTPHLSILYSVPERILTETRKYSHEIMLPLTFTMNNVYVLKNIPGIKRERSIVKQYSFIFA